jgi:hypothetical protein
VVADALGPAPTPVVAPPAPVGSVVGGVEAVLDGEAPADGVVVGEADGCVLGPVPGAREAVPPGVVGVEPEVPVGWVPATA